MTIQYADGKALEAVLLTRTESSMRVAIRGAEDVTEFSKLSGIWISEEGEPVRIVFAWQRHGRKAAIPMDCECSRELAARLIHSLFAAPKGSMRSVPSPGAVASLAGTLPSQHFHHLADQLLHAQRLQ